MVDGHGQALGWYGDLHTISFLPDATESDMSALGCQTFLSWILEWVVSTNILPNYDGQEWVVSTIVPLNYGDFKVGGV